MSLLTAQPQTNDSQRLNRITEQLKFAPRQILEMLVNQWNHSYDSLWSTRGDITVAQKLEALGTSAAELFASSEALTIFIITQCTGKRPDIISDITAKVNAIPAHTTHADGTITLN